MLRALFLLILLFSVPVLAASDSLAPKKQTWSFDGVLGTVDRQSAQRGFQIYKEVCSSCHGLKRIAFRNLGDIGFSENEIKFIAAETSVVDGPNLDGEMFERPGRPSDHFVPPFANEQLAKAANGGAIPPDLSLIIKARKDGPNYVYSLLTGYQDPPSDIKVEDGLHYNPYFSGGRIAMTPPLFDGVVEYMDGTVATSDQMAKDVVNFLQWAAEPEMEQRKGMGAKVLLFLLFITTLLVLANQRTWEKIKK